MLISVRYLIDRMRQPRSRADEVMTLRRRFAAESSRGVGEEEAAAAAELQRLRGEMAAAVGAVEACKSCAVGHPLPHGRFDGGHCCGLVTADAFNDDEVAALWQGGTRGEDLGLPVGEHAGCAFRGPTGCSLGVLHRPNLCLRYLCPDLVRELHRRGDLEPIERIGASMEAAYLRFIALRKERIERESI